MTNSLRFILVAILWLSGLSSTQAGNLAVAFFYGAQPPWEILQPFDLVVVDPDHVTDPRQPGLTHTRLAAYVSVGEVHPDRSYASQLPSAWLIGGNPAWGSRIIDQSAPEWPAFFTEKVIAPLWEAGYRDFFFDTLDSYQLVAQTDADRQRQEAGLVALIRGVKARFPAARLILNRGFEILPEVHDIVFAVAAESLFAGYDATVRQFRPVTESDRAWLLAQLQRVQREYKLPVIVIDYLPAAEREKARQTAQKIASLGFIPWVTTPALDTVGIGLIEVMPRRVLAIHEPLEDEHALRYHSVIRHASMPLNHLGYAVVTADPLHLPLTPQAGQLAGIVVWLQNRLDATAQKKLIAWLEKRLDEGIPLALLGDLSFLFSTPLADRLGMVLADHARRFEKILVHSQSAWIGFERQPRPHPRDFFPLQIRSGEVHLVLGQGTARQVAVATTPWGGYALDPHVIANLPGGDGERWVIDPFAFFASALRLPDMPVPDVTTETGRRLLMVHMDGDAFPSRSELPGKPYAGAVIRDRIVRRYRVPMTISVIEGEISPTGSFPKDSPALEAIARDIFAEPHVEIASHSFSHPFFWHKFRAGDPATGFDGYRLDIPGYRFDLRREIEGSVRYIEERLAPPGKKVAMFLWTGDCIPGSDALRIVNQVGIFNMNGGETTATRTDATLTRVEGLGIARGETFQVFAPNQNENVYTNLWTGPFYGYRRVIETFEFTEQPRRLKPINIYFHTYIATKPEGLGSLEEVFAWALKQETTPVFASEYAAKVLDFQRIAIARTLSGAWRVSGTERLRTLRWPLRLGYPMLTDGSGIAGFSASGEVGYLHLSTARAEWRFAPQPDTLPRLVSANGRVIEATFGEGIARWKLEAHVPLSFTLANIAGCSVSADGRRLKPKAQSEQSADFQLDQHAAAAIEAICRD